MAALTITASNVKRISGVPITRKIATGQTVTAGMLVYLDALEVKVANPSTAATSGASGLYLALNSNGAGQDIVLAQPDSIIDLGVGIQGNFYYLGANGTLDDAYEREDDFVTLVGFINEDGNFVFKPVVSSTPYVAP